MNEFVQTARRRLAGASRDPWAARARRDAAIEADPRTTSRWRDVA